MTDNIKVGLAVLAATAWGGQEIARVHDEERKDVRNAAQQSWTKE